MSSLLSNDFVEEYFRVENNITTNNQTFYVDREGQLIYTTPFFTTEDIISDTKISLGNKNVAQNVNIIIDSIALISTNPNVQNYLPLSIDLGGNKPTIEFSNVSEVTLTDYKIIVEPRINLNTVTNIRYSHPQDCCFELANPSAGTSVVNVIRTGDATNYSYYYLIDTNTGPGTGPLVIYKVINGVSTVVTVNAGEIIQIYGNNQQAVVVTAETILATNFLYIFDLKIGPPTLFCTIEDEPFIDLFLTDNTLVVVTGNPTGPYTYRYYVRCGDKYCNTANIIDAGEPGIILVGIYRKNEFFTYNGSKIVWSRYGPNNAELIRIGEIEYAIDQPIDSFLKLYVGGPNIDRPNVSIFTVQNFELTWYYFDLFTKRPSKARLNVGTNTILMKRYNNTAYFYLDKHIYLFNLDDGTYLKYNITRKNNLVPRQITVVNFSDFDLIVAGNSWTNDNTIVSTIWSNDRPLTSVYKVVYNYSERNFPYYLSDNFIFNLTLPNNTPMADVEIFKYIVDFRIRYDEVAISKELAEPTYERAPDTMGLIADGRKRRDFVRQSRKTGDVDKILGLVDEEFNVADFLNIYT